MDIKKILNEDTHSDKEAKVESGEKEQPKKPMTKKEKIINIIGWIIIILVVVKGCSFMFSDDEKTTDTDTNAVEVQEETEATEPAEPEKTPEEEAKAAIERKKTVEEYSQLIPFEGMDVEYIDCTSCGAHNYDEDSEDEDYDWLYYWETRDTSELERSWFMRVYIKDDKVTDIQRRDYWNDGVLDLDMVLEDRKDNAQLLSGDEEVDSAWTGKEYADSKLDSYKEIVEQDEKYQSLDNESKEAIAWCKALDYWLEKKEARHFYMEQYHETIRNSKK